MYTIYYHWIELKNLLFFMKKALNELSSLFRINPENDVDFENNLYL